MRASLQGITVLLTGATSGIGLVTAQALVKAGAALSIHGRDRGKVEKLQGELSAPGRAVNAFIADLSSLEQTTRLAQDVAERAGALDVLINNAGVGTAGETKNREQSRDGYELRFAVNYLAPFLLTEELLARGLPRRAVINVASAGQEPLDFDDLMTERGFSGVRVYCRSKLALIMMSFTLAELHTGVQVHALHPGTYLDTAMVRTAGIRPLGPASRGADSIMAVLASALDGGAGSVDSGGRSGRYFDETRPSRAMAQAYDPAARRQLRDASLALVAPFRRR